MEHEIIQESESSKEVGTDLSSRIKFSTRNNLPLEVRIQSIAILEDLLATLLDLAGVTKQSHWNVKGPTFIAQHKLYDELVEIFFDLADTLAERITALGGFAKGNAAFIWEESILDPFPDDIVTASQYQIAIADRLSTINGYMLYAIDCLDVSDKVTSNIIQDQLHAIDKAMYFIEAHLTS